MSVWTEFVDGYHEARAADSRRQRRDAAGQDEEPAYFGTADDPRYERLQALFEACAVELADCRRALRDLAAEGRRLHATAVGGDEKFQRFAHVTQKFLHPDRAAGDEHLAAALEDIFKELRAEIDKLEGGT